MGNLEGRCDVIRREFTPLVVQLTLLAHPDGELFEEEGVEAIC